jgi:hypothetical protein
MAIQSTENFAVQDLVWRRTVTILRTSIARIIEPLEVFTVIAGILREEAAACQGQKAQPGLEAEDHYLTS